MPDQPPSDATTEINLKDPVVAGILAWLVPGLGHLYQGRIGKGILLMVCILGTFMTGLCFGSSRDVGWGRVVYVSFRPNDWRLPWLCQVGVGLPTFPVTVIQASLAKGESGPWWNGFMAPPDLESPEGKSGLKQPSPAKMSLGEINFHLKNFFELGTVYTMVAGLLNILAIYDACCGPVPAISEKKPDGPDVGDK